jgi:cytochrome bd ubiquinol oxidase subunit II
MILDLNTIWFVLVGVLFTGYAVLDGFDLGVGALHLFTKTDEERRLFLNAIGPVWDGNEVWLVTGGGALFAAFPIVYASIFSGFYFAFILLLFGLIFRACAIEFRSRQEMKWWRSMWDISFSTASIVCSLLIGVALGNIARGIPLDAEWNYTGTFFGLLNPYSIAVGLTTLALFMMHGSIYILLKTEGPFHEKVRGWTKKTIILFVSCYFVITVATWLFIPHMTVLFKKYPALLFIPLVNLLAIAWIPRAIKKRSDGVAFLASCASMALLMIIFGMGMFPNLVTSIPEIQNSLNIYNAASSAKTLSIMLRIAFIGMPLVIAYTISIYWVFRGKVRLDSSSY